MDFEVVSDERTAYGTSGARSVELKLPDAPDERKVVRFKWKEMSRKATLDAADLEAQNDGRHRQDFAPEKDVSFEDFSRLPLAN